MVIGANEPERGISVDICFSRYLNIGFVDTFRFMRPDVAEKYTWVSNRFRTGGLRLDYFFVSEQLKPHIAKADILREKAANDHCPILLELDL